MKFEINKQNVLNRIYSLLKEIDKREIDKREFDEDDNLMLLHAESLIRGIVGSKKNDK